MLIASYEQWREAKKQVLEEENPEIDCEECGGTGEIHEVCPCCDERKRRSAASAMARAPSVIWIRQVMSWSVPEFTSRK
jgi:hypothetical protein